MEVDIAALRRNSLFMLVTAAFLLVVCELNVILRLRKAVSLHGSDPTLYVLPLLLLIPLVFGLVTRRRLAKWEAGAAMSTAAAAQMGSDQSLLVMISYLLVMLATTMPR
jgi:ACR3 family arsenite efflux pump ArsB